MVGRVGADLSKYDLKYTHAGIIVRDHPKGRWFLRHLLNACATAASGLYDEGPINFFTDNPHKLDAVVIVPSPQLQRRLKAYVLGRWAAELHQPKYSAIANPFADYYKNSNQWILEMVAAAQAGEKIVYNRQTAQAYLANKGFVPDTLSVSGLERMGATLFRANVSFTDHPLQERLQGNYQLPGKDGQNCNEKGNSVRILSLTGHWLLLLPRPVGAIDPGAVAI
jgi:hypothetical protein